MFLAKKPPPGGLQYVKHAQQLGCARPGHLEGVPLAGTVIGHEADRSGCSSATKGTLTDAVYIVNAII